MKGARHFTVLAFVVATAGCFHQVVQTGLPAGSTVVDKPFVATWLWGLIPAKEIDIRSECPSGAAIIETEQSFMNGLVAAITFGIFTPQHVRVTCASGTGSLPSNAVLVVVPEGASASERAEAFRSAVNRSIEQDVAVFVRF